LSGKNGSPTAERFSEQTSKDEGPTPAAEAGNKRKFIEPEISVPVDVLEATTFFQGPTSGVSN
jgi:hypothetical protein